jgi:hypothetical protein
MKKIAWLFLLVLCGSGAFSQDFYITGDNERISCKIMKCFPDHILVKAADQGAKDVRLNAREIKGYERDGVVVFSKRILNSEDSNYILLPAKKENWIYRYSSDFSFMKQKDFSVDITSKGNSTVYIIEQSRTSNAGGSGYTGSAPQMLSIDSRNTRYIYSYYLENDTSGLKVIPIRGKLSKKEKRAILDVVTEYMHDKPALIKKLEEEKVVNKKVLDKLIWDYFEKAVIK